MPANLDGEFGQNEPPQYKVTFMSFPRMTVDVMPTSQFLSDSFRKLKTKPTIKIGQKLNSASSGRSRDLSSFERSSEVHSSKNDKTQVAQNDAILEELGG